MNKKLIQDDKFNNDFALSFIKYSRKKIDELREKYRDNKGENIDNLIDQLRAGNADQIVQDILKPSSFKKELNNANNYYYVAVMIDCFLEKIVKIHSLDTDYKIKLKDISYSKLIELKRI